MYRERPDRLDRRTVEHNALMALQTDGEDDVPDRIPAGWRIGRNYYTPGGFPRNYPQSGNYIVTRPEGYTPYQSVEQSDGRYAYDPNRVQYPRRSQDELNSGRAALHPATRQVEFIVNRSNHYPHQPGEQVRMGIDSSQMRTAAVQPPQQAMLNQYGRPVLPQPVQGAMGPPQGPRYPAGGYGGLGGGYGAQG